MNAMTAKKTAPVIQKVMVMVQRELHGGQADGGVQAVHVISQHRHLLHTVTLS